MLTRLDRSTTLKSSTVSTVSRTVQNQIPRDPSGVLEKLLKDMTWQEVQSKCSFVVWYEAAVLLPLSNLSLQPVNEKPRSICDVELTSEDTKKFKFAVSRQYWMQLFLDDLPIYGLVGEMSEAPEQQVCHIWVFYSLLFTLKQLQHYVYTHWTFDIAHNNDRVISVNMTSENPKEVKVGEKLSFTYRCVHTFCDFFLYCIMMKNVNPARWISMRNRVLSSASDHTVTEWHSLISLWPSSAHHSLCTVLNGKLLPFRLKIASIHI